MKDFFLRLVDFYGQFSTETTVFFCVLIFFICSFLLSKKGELAQIVPGVAVSLGILFTFFGLALSLVSASNDNIQSQFDVLLGGLSTAFWTSVMGMAFSIWSKVYLAKRFDQATHLKEVQKELGYVRDQISGIGDDITKHLSIALQKVIVSFTESISSSLSESGKNIRLLNNEYASQLKELNAGVTTSVDSILSMTQEVSKSLNVIEKASAQTQSFATSIDDIAQRQSKWLCGIEESVASVSELAPEAKAVFQAIEKINESYNVYEDRIGEMFRNNEQRFSKDLEKVTDTIIQHIVGIEGENQERIAKNLEKLDRTVRDSFEVVSHNYGEGMIMLAQKNLGVIAETVEQLELAKSNFSKGSNVVSNDSLATVGD